MTIPSHFRFEITFPNSGWQTVSIMAFSGAGIEVLKLMGKYKYPPKNPIFFAVEDIENKIAWSPPSIEENISSEYSQNYLKRSKDLLNCTDNYLQDSIDKKIIYLSIVGDLNSTEIGKELDLKPDNVRQKLGRLIKKIRKNCLSLWPNQTPYTALKPDNENDVVSVDGCDISLKYPKKIKNVKIDSFEIQEGLYFDKSTQGISLNTLPNLNLPYEKQDRVNELTITCSDANDIAEQEYLFETVSPEDLRKITGWFITSEGRLGPVLTRKPDTASTLPYLQYYFQFIKKYYQILTINEDILKKSPFEAVYKAEMLKSGGIYAEQVQIQFNSLVKNETNTVPKKPTPTEVKTNNPVIDIKLKNEKLFKKEINDLVAAEKNETQAICGLPNAITYRSGNIDEYGNYETEMVIGNKKNYLNDKNLLNSYNRVETFIKDPADKLTESLTGAFTTGCVGGYITRFGAEVTGLKYQNIDKFRVLITMDGQGPILQPILLIYGQKGENIISIQKPLTQNEELKRVIEEIIAICPVEYTDQCKGKQMEYEDKYYKKVTTLEKIAEAKKEAQKLIDLYQIID